jgi:plastocyanin
VLGILGFASIVSVAPAATADGVFVLVDRYSVRPERVTVAAGATLTFQHEGRETLVDPTFPITLIAQRAGGERVFESPSLEPGEVFAFTFNRPGLYRVHVDAQPDVEAEILVE